MISHQKVLPSPQKSSVEKTKAGPSTASSAGPDPMVAVAGDRALFTSRRAEPPAELQGELGLTRGEWGGT